MSRLADRILYWAPRALSIAFIAFISLFALDVFGEGRSFWATVVALLMHLIPTFILIGALALAWKWEWIGATLYGAAALLYIYWAWHRPITTGVKFTWVLTIAGPALVIAALFLANWLRFHRHATAS